MVNLLHDLDLPLDALSPIRLKKFELLVYFDSDFLIKNLVKTDPDDRVRTLTDPLANDVIVNILNVAAFGAELILIIVALLSVRSITLRDLLLVLLDMVSEGVRLRQVCMVQILLLLHNVLVHVLLASSQGDEGLPLSLVRVSLLVGLSLQRRVAARMLGVRVDDAPRLPRLQLPVLIVDVLRCHYLWLALRVRVLLVVPLHSCALDPIVRRLLHPVLVGVATVLVVCVLRLLVLSQLCLARRLHLSC